MYKKELDSLLLKPNPPRAYLLYGASEFLIHHYGKKISTLLAQGQEITTFYYDECEPDSILSMLTQDSLFGGDTFIVLKVDKKFDKKTCEKFLNALVKHPNNALVIEFYIASSKTDAQYMQDCRAFAQSFKNPNMQVAEVRFFEPSIQEGLEFLRARCKEIGIEIHSQDLRYILELQNNNLAIAYKEIEKFSIGLKSQNTDSKSQSQPTKFIDTQSVRFLCEGVASFNTEELNCAIMEKKPIVKILQTLYEEGVNEVALVRDVQRFFYQLFLFFAYIRTKGAPDVGEILGFNPPKAIIERQSRYCMKLKERDYIEIFDLLNSWDLEAKSGKSKNSTTILMKIQAMIG